MQLHRIANFEASWRRRRGRQPESRPHWIENAYEQFVAVLQELRGCAVPHGWSRSCMHCPKHGAHDRCRDFVLEKDLASDQERSAQYTAGSQPVGRGQVEDDPFTLILDTAPENGGCCVRNLGSATNQQRVVPGRRSPVVAQARSAGIEIAWE